MGNLVVLFHRPASKSWFESIVNRLARTYKFIGQEELIEYYQGKRDLKNACHITFDDGELSVYNEAYPVLREKGIPATLFVSPTVISEKKNYWFQEIKFLNDKDLIEAFQKRMNSKQELNGFKISALLKAIPIDQVLEVIRNVKNQNHVEIPCQNMNSTQLKELTQDNVFEIGAHTLEHPILKNETSIRAKQEIEGSVVELGKMLDQPVRSFAYPNGLPGIDYTNREKEVLRNTGIELSFSCRYGYFKKSDDPMEIPRLEVEAGSPQKIALKANYFPELLYSYIKVKGGGPFKTRKKIHEMLNAVNRTN